MSDKLVEFDGMDDLLIAVCMDGKNGTGTALCFFRAREDVNDPKKVVLRINFPSNDSMYNYVNLVRTMLNIVNEGLAKQGRSGGGGK